MLKDIFGEAFPILEKFAPLLAGAVGSPGASFGTAVALNVLARAFDLPPNELGQIKEAIVSDPEAQNKLETIEGNFSNWFKNNHLTVDMDIKIHCDNKD